MSARATFLFQDAQSRHMVYKQFDGWPAAAAESLRLAREATWPNRFEADEFACAFVAAARSGRGDMRLVADPGKPCPAAWSYRVSWCRLARALRIDAWECVDALANSWRCRGTDLSLEQLADVEKAAPSADARRRRKEDG